MSNYSQSIQASAYSDHQSSLETISHAETALDALSNALDQEKRSSIACSARETHRSEPSMSAHTSTNIETLYTQAKVLLTAVERIADNWTYTRFAHSMLTDEDILPNSIAGSLETQADINRVMGAMLMFVQDPADPTDVAQAWKKVQAIDKMVEQNFPFEENPSGADVVKDR